MKKRDKKKHSRSKKHDLYPAVVLMLLLILVIEIGFLKAPEAADSAVGELFNLWGPAQESAAGLAWIVSPAVQTFNDISLFYQMAADEMTELLDMSKEGEELTFLFRGVVAGVSTSCN
ncbi:MAG: hypothetical protein HYV13_04215 [Candidatus Doudnabacteria bacterium]|nr:hypothetical protein [Candidatus Doudnabacteria bacterium]